MLIVFGLVLAGADNSATTGDLVEEPVQVGLRGEFYFIMCKCHGVHRLQIIHEYYHFDSLVRTSKLMHLLQMLKKRISPKRTL